MSAPDQPRSDSTTAEAAKASGFDLPDICVEGVTAGLAALADHAARLRQAMDEIGL